MCDCVGSSFSLGVGSSSDWMYVDCVSNLMVNTGFWRSRVLVVVVNNHLSMSGDETTGQDI